jgi:voltage-gated potassium channel
MRDALQHHVIVVGFGRVGQAIVTGLRELGRECVVLDRNAERQDEVKAAGAIEVVGDATSEDDLRKAGIDRADALIAACDTDAENLVVVLTARSARHDLRIVSRVNEAAWSERIKRAGADVAQSPYPSYGMSLAAAATSPAVLDLHDLPLLGLGTEEIEIPAGSPTIGLAPIALTNTHPSATGAGQRRFAPTSMCGSGFPKCTAHSQAG